MPISANLTEEQLEKLLKEEPEFLGLEAFLNETISISNPGMNVYPGDVLSFANHLGEPQAKKFLAHVNTDLIIRAFFYYTTLYQSEIHFFKNALIYFKNISVNSKMGFLELFLLVKYNYRLCPANNPNTEINETSWGNSMCSHPEFIEKLKDKINSDNTPIANYKIEIIPPSYRDITCILEQLNRISNALSHHFTPVPTVPFQTLLFKIQNELKNIYSNTQAAFDFLYDSLLKLHLSEKPVNSFTEDAKPENAIANTNLAPAQITQSIIDTARGHLKQMYSINQQEGSVKISINSMLSRYPIHSKIYTTFLSRNILLHLFTLLNVIHPTGKIELLKLESNNNDSDYYLKQWLLGHVATRFLDFSRSTKTLKEKLNYHGTSQWAFKSNEYTFPFAIFNQAMIIKYQLPMKFKKMINVINKENKLLARSTVDLLNKFFKLPPTSGENFFFFSPIEFENNASDYQIMLYHTKLNFRFITAVSCLIPQMPLPIYPISGFVTLVPSDLVSNKILYKRCFLPTSSSIAVSGYEFPQSTANFRSKGGKFFSTLADFFRSLLIIDYRTTGKLYDGSRKQFLAMLFKKFPDQSFINQPLDLAKAIFELLLNKVRNNENNIDENRPDAEKNMFRLLLLLYYEIEASIENLAGFDAIVNYYFDLLREIAFQAIYFHKSLSFVLDERITHSNMERKSESKQYNNEPKLISAAFFQGLRIRNNKKSAWEFSYDLRNFSKVEMIKSILVSRHGNFPAIYADTSSLAELVSAEKIALFMKEEFNQDLPIVIYDKETGKAHALPYEKFKARYLQDITVSLKTDFSNKNIFKINISDEEEEKEEKLEISLSTAISDPPATTDPRTILTFMTSSSHGAPAQTHSPNLFPRGIHSHAASISTQAITNTLNANITTSATQNLVMNTAPGSSSNALNTTNKRERTDSTTHHVSQPIGIFSPAAANASSSSIPTTPPKKFRNE